MAKRAMNFKMEEADILDMKQVAGVFNMFVTDLIKNAVKEYLAELKNDPFYRLTANVQDASDEGDLAKASCNAFEQRRLRLVIRRFR